MTKSLLPVILVAALLVGCSRSPVGLGTIEEGEQSPPATIQPPPANSGKEPLPHNRLEDPITIRVELDSSRAVEELITLEGGVISAAGSDGTRFNLDIPAGALREPVRIRMTPLAQISGLPFGNSSAYAVHLEPEGLFFYDFAVLTIEPPEEMHIESQIPFGYRENGGELFLVPPVVQSTEIKIQLLHFSGYGVAKGLLSDIEPVRHRLGGSAETRLQSIAAELLMVERQRQLLGGADDNEKLWEELDALAQEFYQQVIQPRIDAAGSSCAAGRLALETLIAHERQRQLLGVSSSDGLGDGPISLNELFEIVARTCLQEEFEMCRDQHVIHRIIPAWLSIEREAQILGAAGPEGESSLAAVARRFASQCLRFELEFESEGKMGPDGATFISTVAARVPLQLDGALNISGQAPLVNTSFSVFVDGCVYTPKTGDGTFLVFGLSYETTKDGAEFEIGKVGDFILLYYPGLTAESYSFSCGSDGTVHQSSEGPLWTMMYYMNHVEEYNPVIYSPGVRASTQPQLPETINAANYDIPAIYEATGWKIIGGELFAEREWQNTSSLHESVWEKGSFKLYHRP